jgi:hypothetical protein
MVTVQATGGEGGVEPVVGVLACPWAARDAEELPQRVMEDGHVESIRPTEYIARKLYLVPIVPGP